MKKMTRPMRLVLMGGGCLITAGGLVGCSDPPPPPIDERIFLSQEQCVAETKNESMCVSNWRNAERVHALSAPVYRSEEECAADFGAGACRTPMPRTQDLSKARDTLEDCQALNTDAVCQPVTVANNTAGAGGGGATSTSGSGSRTVFMPVFLGNTGWTPHMSGMTMSNSGSPVLMNRTGTALRGDGVSGWSRPQDIKTIPQSSVQNSLARAGNSTGSVAQSIANRPAARNPAIAARAVPASARSAVSSSGMGRAGGFASSGN